MKANASEAAPEAAVPRWFVVEHFEEEFSEWTFKEYVHMLLTMANVHSKVDKPPHCQMLLTNFKFLQALRSDQLKEDELKSKSHMESFARIAHNIKRNVFKNNSPVFMTQLSLEELTSRDFKVPENGWQDDSEVVLELFAAKQVKFNSDLVCMMDMRAEEDLKPTDAFQFMVFGGILGNHPPEDRA